MYYTPSPQEAAFERAEYLFKGNRVIYTKPWPDGSLNIYQKTPTHMTHEESLQYFEVCKQEVENIKKANKWGEYHG